MQEKSSNRRCRRKKRWLAVCCVLLFSAGIPFAVSGFMHAVESGRIRSAEEAAGLDADCILVLGAGVYADGSLSPMLNDRLSRGVELYQNGAAPKLLMSGDHGTAEYDEVNAMKQFALDHGVRSEDVFMDHAGFSTYESIYRAQAIFGAKRVVIVTQRYHLYRALYLARRMGLEAYGVASDLRAYSGQPYYSAREILAQSKDFLKALFHPEPTYLGETIPISGNGDLTNDREFL